MSGGRIHPLTGEPILPNGKANGRPRREMSAYFAGVTNNRRTNQSYDAARSGTDLDGHWAFADSLDGDSSNSRTVRHTLIKRSRYESGSNGYYAGIINTHCNMLVGVGPTLRMLTGSRAFNQLVEREFYAWWQAVQMRRKLWCMAYARTGDGESFGVLQTNPGVNNRVQLDVMVIEAEQCQTPFPFAQKGYIDGIRYDEAGNVLWYDILPEHPGSSQQLLNADPVKVPASNVLHWFKLKRGSAHRGGPDLTSTLNCGASGRRWREATVAAAETAADLSAISTTQHGPATGEEPEPMDPFIGVPLPKRTWLFNPMGWDVHQMRAEHPNAGYGDFHRSLVSEQARPLSMPYNAAACDSSTYSFASGKLDTLGYRTGLDVERCDCNDLVLDRIFAAWFREWTIIAARRDIPPNHQWDWPSHPVIDAVAENNATDTKLKNGTITQRQVFSDQGQDFEDQLVIMAEDWFGEASEENIAKARQINMLRNVPQSALPYVAQIIGLPAAQPTGGQSNVPAQVA